MELHTTEKSLHGWGRTAPTTAHVLSTEDVEVITMILPFADIQDADAAADSPFTLVLEAAKIPFAAGFRPASGGVNGTLLGMVQLER